MSGDNETWTVYHMHLMFNGRYGNFSCRVIYDKNNQFRFFVESNQKCKLRVRSSFATIE